MSHSSDTPSFVFSSCPSVLFFTPRQAYIHIFSVSVSSTVCVIQSVTACMFIFFFKKSRSRTSVRTHTKQFLWLWPCSPSAVLLCLLIVTQLSLSTAFITTLQPLHPWSLLQPSEQPRTVFRDLRLAIRSQVRQAVSSLKASLRMQLKRSEAQRQTNWTSKEGAHFNSEYGTAKSGISLSRTHRKGETHARKRTKIDRVTAPRYPNSKRHRQQGVTDRGLTRTCARLWRVSCKDCVHHADLQHARQRNSPGAAARAQQPKRSSPSAEAAVPPGGTEPSPAENAHTIMSSKLLLQHSDLQQ